MRPLIALLMMSALPSVTLADVNNGCLAQISTLDLAQRKLAAARVDLREEQQRPRRSPASLATYGQRVEAAEAEQAEAERAMKECAEIVTAADAAADAAEKRRRDLLANQKISNLVHSAAICALGEWKGAELKELATEKKYAKVGGVINKRKMYEAQLRLRAIDDAILEHRKAGGKPNPCSTKIVSRVARCYLPTVKIDDNEWTREDPGDGPTWCETAEVKEIVSLIE